MGETAVYGAKYYETGCGPLPYERSEHWLNFFGRIAEELIRALKPTRVFDAGCAFGFLVESFWDRGVYCEGADISEYAITQVRKDMARYCRVQSLTEPLPGRFDLITCIEVLEHMEAADSKIAVANLCSAADSILFSSTPSDFTEQTHVNVQPVRYWLDLFAEQGFGPDLDFDAAFLTPHAFLARKGFGATSDLLRLFSDHLRLKSLLRTPRVAVENDFTVEVQVFPRVNGAFSPDAPLGQRVRLKQWEEIAFALPATTCFRLDPADRPAAIEIKRIAAVDADSGTVAFSAEQASDFDSLQVAGTAIQVDTPDDGGALRMLSYGPDPQIILPELKIANSSGRINLQITLRVDTDESAITGLMARYLSGQQASIDPIQSRAATSGGNNLRRALDELDEVRHNFRLLSDNAAKTRADLIASQKLAKQLQQEIDLLRGGQDDVAVLRAQLSECNQTLANVLGSVSWKLTGPLRSIMSKMRGGPRSR